MTRAVTPISPVRIPNTDIHYAPGIKAGNWVFLTGIEAADYASGLHPSVAGNPDLPYHGLPRHRREGDFICRKSSEGHHGTRSQMSKVPYRPHPYLARNV